jgi:8-oxo-dGTP pyrophosphatase MutT (NUDIX family)
VKLVDVRQLVEAHRVADDRERAYRSDLIRLLDTVGDPWERRRVDPGHLTASAFVLHPTSPAIAMVHHAKLDLWVQPGGHVEIGDPTHEDAAKREVAEEIGVTELTTVGVLDLDIHVFPERPDQAGHLHFDLRWAFRSSTTGLVAGDGALEARWVPWSEALLMDESIARPVRKLVDL